MDPPYPFSTRSGRQDGYAHELSDDEHRALADRLNNIAGAVVLSGYPCPLYDQELYSEWHRVERDALADKGAKRTEVLWINEAAWQGLERIAPQMEMAL